MITVPNLLISFPHPLPSASLYSTCDSCKIDNILFSFQLTPAESRNYNKQCGLLQFYDTHDVWHFLSAAAMFFSFMLLLVIDDDITHKPRDKIPVF